MKHLNIAVVAVLSLSAVSAAQGQIIGGSYVVPSVGINFFHDRESGDAELKFDPGFSIGVMAGRKLPILPLRLEAGFEYHQADYKISSGEDPDMNRSVSAIIWRTNGWVDVPVFGEDFIPYVGGGLGAVNLDLDTEIEGLIRSVDDWYFTWQAGAGVGVSIIENLVLDAGYRYSQFSNEGEDNGFSRIDVTARYTF